MNCLILRAAAIVLAASIPPIAGLTTGSAAAAPAKMAAPATDTDTAGLAARGYDVTAYFTSGRPVRGLAKYAIKHNDAVFRFASNEALERFKDNPAAFTPRFGGYCAWAVSQGYIAPGDPEQWAIVDDRLYLNFNSRAKALWDADRPAAITRGNNNWPSVLKQNQDS